MLHNLEQKRKSADFTQRELAKVLGVTERQYQRLEAGTSDGSIKVWKQLSKLFDTTIDYLLEQRLERRTPCKPKNGYQSPKR